MYPSREGRDGSRRRPIRLASQNSIALSDQAFPSGCGLIHQALNSNSPLRFFGLRSPVRSILTLMKLF